MRKKIAKRCGMLRGAAAWAAALGVLIAAAGLFSCSIDSTYTELLAEKIQSDSAADYYSAKGILDTSFGGDGVMTHHGAAGGNGNDGGASITHDAQGRILVCGASDSGTDFFDLAIWRYK